MTDASTLLGGFALAILRYTKEQQLVCPNLQNQLLQYSKSGNLNIQQFGEYLDDVYQLDPVPALGLRIARLVQADDFGILGELTHSCSTLRQALSRYRHFRALVMGQHPVTVIESNKTIKIQWSQEPEYTAHALEFSLGAIIALYQSLIGSSLPPKRAGLSIPTPSNPAVYEALLGCTLEFQCSQSYIDIPSKFMAKRIEGSNLTRRKKLEETIKNKIQNNLYNKENLYSKVHYIIKSNLSNKRINPRLAAQQLKIPVHQFHQLLSEHNTTFRELVTQIRMSIAQDLLSNTEHPLSDIAKQIGYSEQSSFIRAFKSWTGYTPGKYRIKYSEI